MNNRLARIIRPICFVLIFILVFSYTSEIVRKEYLGMINTYYEEPDDSLDVVFVGPSTTFYTINPMQLWKDYGIASYDFSSPSQTFAASYYAIREVVETQDPEVVVFDVLTAGTNDSKLPASEAHQHFFTDTLRPSEIRTECINDLIEEDREDYFFPFLAYHSRWAELTRDDFMPKVNYAKGFYPNYTAKVYENLEPLVPENETAEMFDVTKEYFAKIVDFCKENDVQLLLTSPANNKGADYQRLQNALEQEAKKHDIPFISFKRMASELGLDPKTDYMDSIHLNGHGAKKVTNYIGQYLIDNYDIPDRRNDPDYADWHDAYEIYEMWDMNYRLSTITNFTEWLNAIDRDNYTVVMTVQDDGSKYFYDEYKEAFKQLGLTPFEGDEYLYSYLAVLSDGKVLFEDISPDQYVRFDRVIDGVHIIASSKGYPNEGITINIDGTEYAMRRSGINVAVYDNWSGKVVDKACFTTNLEETICRR